MLNSPGASAAPVLMPAFVPSQPSTPSPLALESASPLTTDPESSLPRVSSPATKFFTRSRSNSMHSSPTTPSSSKAIQTPPLPPLPTEHSVVPIKSCSVPYHLKVGGKWTFACRVVPDTTGENGLDVMARAISRKTSSGRTAIAGNAESREREPYTIWRSWNEFVELSAALQMAFPSGATPSSSPANSPAASSSSIPAFSRQTPRLSKKLTLFVTRATLVTRQADVDFFVRRLFEMPAIVSNSPLVREFFKMRPVDLVQNAPTPTDLVPSTPHNDHDLFAQFLTEKDKSPQATIRSPPPGKGLTASRRPRLGLKYSTPNLRSAYDADEASDVAPLPSPIPETSKLFGRGTIRPGMLPRATTLGLYNGRESFCSASASSISTATPTSAFFSTSPTALDPPPASPTITSSFDEPTPPSSTIKKRPSGPLRHFRSLQDLRHNFSTSSLLPTPPLPTSTGMDRARTQPPLSQSVPQYVPARTTLAGPNSAPSTSRDRSGSRSSIHSLEESLRHGASSRLHGIPETLAQQKRRPSMPLRSTSVATKASCGHSPSSSYDSLRSAGDRNSSLDMSRSFSGHQSGRSSTDLSDVGSQHPATPPTPYSDGRDRDVGGKYYLSDGELTINNKVPLPPFFPVPPSMTSAPMQVSHSYDTYEGMPQHRRTGSDVRSRAGSAASHRPILDTIHASPKLGSPVGSNRSTHPRRLPLVTPLSSPDPSSLTFKIIHTETICLRLSRTITLDALKAQVLAKFAEVAILLDDSFSLASASTPCTTEQEFQSILDSIATLDKLSLRIVSAPLEILA